MDRPPTRFCNTCGNLMGRKRRIFRYDEATGKPDYQYDFTCPRRRFWRLGHLSLIVYGGREWDTRGQD